MEETSYPILRVEQSQHRQRVDRSRTGIQSVNLNGRQFRSASRRECVLARRGCHHNRPCLWHSENCSPQLEFPTAAHDDEKQARRFMQNVNSVFPVQMFRIGIDGFSSPETLWSCIVDGSSANNDGIRRSPQQAHDKAISGVRATYNGAASLTFYCIADNTVERGDEVCKDVGTLRGRCLEVQISIVEISQARWESRFRFVLITINESSYGCHLFASSFSEHGE